MGAEWDGANGFRRSLNPADAGRDGVFGRTSRKAPECRTVGAGKRNAPGIGERKTEWVSNAGWNAHRCETCGHLPHGGSPCRCENPRFVAADDRWPLYQRWCQSWGEQVLRVLKPGGFAAVFGGTRTFHRLTCALEDAGFEVRDVAMYLHMQGFPKNRACLKPCYEPIVLCRKPGPRVLPLNIDAARVDPGSPVDGGGNNFDRWRDGEGRADRPPSHGVRSAGHDLGRWPGNVLFDGSPDAFAAHPDAARFFLTAKPTQEERHMGMRVGTPVRIREGLTPEQRAYVLEELRKAGVQT